MSEAHVERHDEADERHLTRYEKGAFAALRLMVTSATGQWALEELARAIRDRSYYADRGDARIETLTNEIDELRTRLSR